MLPLRFEALATLVLGWKPSKLAGSPSGPGLPESLDLVLPEFGETLRPTFAVPAVKEDDAEWMMLVQELADGTSFDQLPVEETKKWHASPQIRIERLLRETGVSIGILTNGRFIRLVYAPRGESSGHVTWPVQVEAVQAQGATEQGNPGAGGLGSIGRHRSVARRLPLEVKVSL